MELPCAQSNGKLLNCYISSQFHDPVRLFVCLVKTGHPAAYFTGGVDSEFEAIINLLEGFNVELVEKTC